MLQKREIEKHKTFGDEITAYRTFLRKYFFDFFTEESENFLCFSTRFEEDERITIEQAFNHMFFINFDQTGYLRSSSDFLNNLLNMFLKNDNLEISKMYLNSILKNLCSYYIHGERWFELEEESPDERSLSSVCIIEKENSLIKFLSSEFGVSVGHLWNRLQQIKSANYKYVEIEGTA